MMRWVADTGPVLHLAEAEALDLLPMLGEVVLPPAVREELSRQRFPVNLSAALRVLPLDERHRAEAEDWRKAGLIDRGESEAIALARQMGADFLLTDDAAARLLATTLGLQARGSLGVVLWLAGQHRIAASEATRTLDRLAHSSLWVSSRVLAEAHSALKEISS